MRASASRGKDGHRSQFTEYPYTMRALCTDSPNASAGLALFLYWSHNTYK